MVVLRVDVRAGYEEGPDELVPALRGGHLKRRPAAVLRACGDIGVGLQELGYDCSRAVVPSRGVERRPAFLVPRIDVRPGRAQGLHRFRGTAGCG